MCVVFVAASPMRGRVTSVDVSAATNFYQNLPLSKQINMKTFIPSPPTSSLTTQLLSTSPSEIANSARHRMSNVASSSSPLRAHPHLMSHHTGSSASLSRMRRFSQADNMDHEESADLEENILADVMLPGDIDLVEETILDVRSVYLLAL